MKKIVVVAMLAASGFYAYSSRDRLIVFGMNTLANLGNAKAQAIYGMFCYKGEGVAKDYTEAQKWFRKAADQGYAAAQYNLGMLYYEGTGVVKDHAEALRWFRKAADQGNAAARANVEMMRANGEAAP